MNSDSLCIEGVEAVKSTGTPAAQVAAGIIAARWESIPDDVKRSLAAVGLASIVNDEMSRQRAHEVIEREREAWEESRGRREAEGEENFRTWKAREAEQRSNAKRRKDQGYRDEIDRVHAASCCFHGGDGPGDWKKREWCVLSLTRDRDPRTIPKEELDALIENRVSYQDEVERCHSAMLCPYHRDEGVAGFAKRAECVRKYLCDGRDPREVPPEELAAKIEECSKTPREEQERRYEALRVIGKYCEDVGYRKAVENMRSIMLVSSDGSMKSLLDFTLADVRQWKKKSRANAASWKARKEFFETAEKVLKDAGAESICDLPPERIEELAEQAEAIWKKRRQPKDAPEEVTA